MLLGLLVRQVDITSELAFKGCHVSNSFLAVEGALPKLQAFGKAQNKNPFFFFVKWYEFDV